MTCRIAPRLSRRRRRSFRPRPSTRLLDATRTTTTTRRTTRPGHHPRRRRSHRRGSQGVARRSAREAGRELRASRCATSGFARRGTSGDRRLSIGQLFPLKLGRGIKTSRVLTSASLRIQCQGDDGRHCVRGRGRQADGQPMWVVPSETPIVESCSVLMTSITPLSRPARTCPRPGRVWDRRAWRRRPDRPHFCAFC